MSEVLVPLPDSIHRGLSEIAEANGTSIESLMAAAASEKLSAMRNEAEYQRALRTPVSKAEFLRILAKAPDVPPDPGDELE